MPEIEPTAELHEGFSQPDAMARPWAEVVDVLSKSEKFGQAHPDGRGRSPVSSGLSTSSSSPLRTRP